MLTPEQLKRVLEEAQQPERWMYLSFADDDGFKGAVVVKANGIITAVARCHLLGINPGGQVLGVEIAEEATLPAPEYRERLLRFEELEGIFGPMTKMGIGMHSEVKEQA